MLTEEERGSKKNNACCESGQICSPMKDFMDYNTQLTSNRCICVLLFFEEKIRGLKGYTTHGIGFVIVLSFPRNWPISF